MAHRITYVPRKKLRKRSELRRNQVTFTLTDQEFALLEKYQGTRTISATLRDIVIGHFVKNEAKDR